MLYGRSLYWAPAKVEQAIVARERLEQERRDFLRRQASMNARKRRILDAEPAQHPESVSC